MEHDSKHFSADTLQSWAEGIFQALELPIEDAAVAARILVNTSLRGMDTHGIIYTLTYAQDIKEGRITPRPEIKTVQDSLATALLDGGNSLGLVVGKKAMNLAIAKAKETGAGVVGVRNSTHFGAAASYAQQASAQGLIGLCFSNTPPVMAPWGSKSLFVGNNPLAIAAPGGIEGGLSLDMAMTNVAWGKMHLAARAGRKMPLDWATDLDGNPTDEPKIGMEGLMLPLGGHKGYGLAVMIEILTSILTGAAYGPELNSGLNWGHCFLAIDIERFLPLAAFKKRLSQLVKDLHDCQPSSEGQNIYAPGEIEAQTMAHRRKEGIPVPDDLIADLKKLGHELGVVFPTGSTRHG